MMNRTKKQISYAAFGGVSLLIYQIIHGLFRIGMGTLTSAEYLSIATISNYFIASLVFMFFILAAFVTGGRIRGNDIVLAPIFAWFIGGGIAIFLLTGFVSWYLRWSSFLLGGLVGVTAWAGLIGATHVVKLTGKPNQAL